ncbi:MAG TPA: hypothetical protein VMU36_09925, partial [Spirochaetia bacterium]|nr:hypothetical protein [Spirochaetia bacterium]
SQNTNFTIEGLRTETGGQDVFSLGVGKVRTVAGRASGKDKYQIRTQSAICGVRGSDIVVEFLEATTSRLYTLEGTGWIQNVASGKELDVPQGDFADSLAASFQVAPIPQDVLSGLQKEMTFSKLDPGAANALEKADQQELQNQGQQPPQSSTTSPGFMDTIFTALHDILGMEIGSVTIGGQTYGKAILEPTFTLGKLKLALYLPIIYQNNMLDSAEWYRPAGNDEWSFGTDQGGNPGLVAADITRDLLLKVTYIEYGRQQDPFFLKVGTLEHITIGHGLLMRDFANDAEFPAVRRVGVNIGVDTPAGGFEVMMNDATPNIANGTVYPPDIISGRVYVRPIPGFRSALGLSAVVDLNPARDFFDPANPGLYGPAAAGNPIFINPGVDFELPLVESDFFGLALFADGAVTVPYLRSTPTDPSFASLSPGFSWNAVYNPSSSSSVKNWGTATGFFGNLIIPDFLWRLEYRYFTGTFQPQLFDTAYGQNRSAYVLGVLQYLADINNPIYDNIKMGIYGEGRLTLNRIFALRLGYFWPWTINQSGSWGPDPNNPDHFIASFEIERGVIPIVKVWGSISYERSNLFSGAGLPSTLSDAVFNANTSMTAQISYPVSPIMDVSLLYTITPVVNPDGSLRYGPGNTLPDMTTSVSITTSIHL